MVQFCEILQFATRFHEEMITDLATEASLDVCAIDDRIRKQRDFRSYIRVWENIVTIPKDINYQLAGARVQMSLTRSSEIPK